MSYEMPASVFPYTVRKMDVILWAEVRVKLSTKKIVKIALQLIEQKGLEKFSMRSLATKLKIEPMSVYHYFPSRLSLLNAILDEVLQEASFLSSDRNWKERITHAATEWRRLAEKYPHFYHFMALHRMNTTTAIIFVDSIMKIFIDAGLSENDAADHFRAMSFFIAGGALDVTSRFSIGPTEPNPISEIEFKHRFPTVYAFRMRCTPENEKLVFDMGLRFLIEATDLRIPKIKPKS